MAISSPFSNVDDVRNDLPSITEADFSDKDIKQCITDGDKEVVSDLSKVVDMGELSEIPDVIARLSHYKACELTLLRVINNAAIITSDNSLLKYWQGKYEELLKKVVNGTVLILDSDYDTYSEDEITKPNIGKIV